MDKYTVLDELENVLDPELFTYFLHQAGRSNRGTLEGNHLESLLFFDHEAGLKSYPLLLKDGQKSTADGILKVEVGLGPPVLGLKQAIFDLGFEANPFEGGL